MSKPKRDCLSQVRATEAYKHTHCSMPLKFYDCLLCSIIVALDNWYSRLESACVNPILLNLRIAISHLKFFHTLKASNMTLVCNCFNVRGHGLLTSQCKWIFHIQRLPAIIFTVSLTTAFIWMWGKGRCGWREPGFDWTYCYLPRVLVTCHISFSSSQSSPPSLCFIMREVLPSKMQHSFCDSNFTAERGTSMEQTVL